MTFEEFNSSIEKKNRQTELNKALAEQIKAKEDIILKERKKWLDMEKKAGERAKISKEESEKALLKKKQEEIKNGKFEIEKTLKKNEMKKDKERQEIEKERQKLIKNQDKYKFLDQEQKAKRENQMKTFANELRRQIEERLNENKKEKEDEINTYKKMSQMKPQISPKMCPHGRHYICAYCKRDFPRAMLTKRTLKH